MISEREAAYVHNTNPKGMRRKYRDDIFPFQEGIRRQTAWKYGS